MDEINLHFQEAELGVIHMALSMYIDRQDPEKYTDEYRALTKRVFTKVSEVIKFR